MSTGSVNAERTVFTVPASGVTVPLTLTIAVVPPEAGVVMGLPSGVNQNYSVRTIVAGSPSESGLLLQHHDFDEPGGVRHTVTFSRSVSNLRVRFAGIGYDSNGQDQLNTQGYGFSPVTVAGSTVGASRRWFFTSTFVSNLLPTDPRGHLLLEHAGALSAEAFDFGSAGFNGAGSDGIPPNIKEMYIGDISFTVV